MVSPGAVPGSPGPPAGSTGSPGSPGAIPGSPGANPGSPRSPLSRRAAVLGSPIAHSLSPVLHRAAYAALGLEWNYDALECERADLGARLDAVRGDEAWAGLSLTMPLKLDVLGLLDVRAPLAETLGAANTVLRQADGSLIGHNTDVAGVAAALTELGLDRVPTQALVLGGGGSARAVVAALGAFGVQSLRVAVRETARGLPIQALGAALGVEVTLVRWRDAPDELAGAALVVSTVPSGAADALGLEWPTRAALVDVLYHPWPTAIARAASAAGARVVGGLPMLVAQAAGQVELMTGRQAPIKEMRAAGEAALAERG